MKLQAVRYVGLLTLLASQIVVAQAAERSGPFWKNVHDLVERCSVQTYTIKDGKKVNGRLKANCEEITVVASRAEFRLENKNYVATIEESPNADGGDLNNVYVQDSTGATIAQRNDVLAFGDILLGLAGGQVESPELYVQPESLE